MSAHRHLLVALAALAMFACNETWAAQVKYYTLPRGAHPHDVAPAPDGMVWYTAQAQGAIGILDPKTGKTVQLPLGRDSVVGPDRAAWVTKGEQNVIARVDSLTRAVKLFPLPKNFPDANLNTATFDRKGMLWFTGQNGVYGRVDPATGKVEAWKVWTLPNSHAGCYAVYVDEKGKVGVSDWTNNAIVRFDPASEKFASFPSDRRGVSVRQLLGRPGEVWGAESGTDRLVMVRD